MNRPWTPHWDAVQAQWCPRSILQERIMTRRNKILDSLSKVAEINCSSLFMKRISTMVCTCGNLWDLILQLQTQLYLILPRVLHWMDTVFHSCNLAVRESGHRKCCRLFLFFLHVAFTVYWVIKKAFGLRLLLLNNSSLLTFASYFKVEEVARVFNLLRV